MKTFSWWRSLCAVLAVVGVVSTSVVSVASADVWHGHRIYGAIERTFHRLGGHARFGDAVTPEYAAGRGGRFQVFQRDASIYWHPRVSNGVARQVGGRIRDRWGSFGWENGKLGYPVTDELTTPDGVGRFNHFEGGSIYWTPRTGARQIEGWIFNTWGSLGYETGFLGYPVTDELTTPDGRGRFNHFEGGSIYFHPSHGAFAVSGKIRDVWQAHGWETGHFGYPVSAVYEVDGGLAQDFVGGTIYSFEPTGVVLPRYDNARYSSYVFSLPLLRGDELSRWDTAGISREFIRTLNSSDVFAGCPAVVGVGSTCQFAGIGHRGGSAVVTHVADTGLSWKTNAGHPEGTDRVLNVRLGDAPVGEVLFVDDQTQRWHTADDSQWVYLIVEVFGDTSSTRAAGVFSSDHTGRQVWPGVGANLRQQVLGSSTRYAKLEG